jgi:hypothetical protein
MSKARYLKMRQKYTPRKPKLIFVCESPPVSGRYFYDESGEKTEPLFRAMMCDVLEIVPRDKENGLRAFLRKGYLLVDSTYTPVNEGLSRKERNDVIREGYRDLKSDLGRVCRKDTPIVLVKSNVCRLLEHRLACDGFWVMNDRVRVPFPAYGWQKEFAKRVAAILRRGGRSSC